MPTQNELLALELGTAATVPGTCSPTQLANSRQVGAECGNAAFVPPCSGTVIYGCTNPAASNYNPAATVSDNTCVFPPPNPVLGCTDSAATNYNPLATADDDSCVYAPFPKQGCTNEDALNYDSTAVVNDGSCIFAPPVLGCTDSTALNYNPLATQDDGTCAYAPPLVSPFDFAVLRYIWTEDGGRDLDTRTAISSPSRNVDVGWDREFSDEDLLIWGGDNTTISGVESVLIDFKTLALLYPDSSQFSVRMRAFWYGEGYDPEAEPSRSGRFTIEFATYLGGTMEQVGFDFINTGGVLQQDVFLVRQSFTDDVRADVDGDNMAALVYDPATKLASIIPSPAPPMPPPSLPRGNNFPSPKSS